jgi:hypothetical protein
MPDYRSNRIAGATYFSVNLLDRLCDVLVAYTDARRGAQSAQAISIP